MTFTRSSDSMCHSEMFSGGQVTELHLDNKAAAQLSRINPEWPASDNREGLLIRVWGPNQLHEYGGGNSNCVSLTIFFEEDGTPIISNANLNTRTP